MGYYDILVLPQNHYLEELLAKKEQHAASYLKIRAKGNPE